MSKGLSVVVNPGVQLAVPRDAGAIALFSREHIEQGLRWGYTPMRILRAIRGKNTNVAVIKEQARLRAFGIMDYGDSSAHLVLLGVLPERQGRGFGGLVLDWLEKSALTAGLESVRVEARADNPAALGFYQKQGYRMRERLAGYYYGVVDAVRLTKPLLSAVGPAQPGSDAESG